jgi:hypothetical protein
MNGTQLLVASCALGALVALGAAWRLDRARGWETPRWDPDRFVLIRDAAHREGNGGHTSEPDLPVAGERWVVAIQPLCPHCRESLSRLVAARARHEDPVEIEALIVDSSRRPLTTILAETGVDRVWWDERNDWRRRWGHRVYGEILIFDTNGAHVRSLPPLLDGGEDPLDPALGVPPDDL